MVIGNGRVTLSWANVVHQPSQWNEFLSKVHDRCSTCTSGDVPCDQSTLPPSTSTKPPCPSSIIHAGRCRWVSVTGPSPPLDEQKGGGQVRGDTGSYRGSWVEATFRTYALIG